MTTPSDIAGRFWNLPQKGREETEREQLFMDDVISKAHIERLLLEHLDGVQTAFDGGAGAGRFSLLLAAHGIHVTHFDISAPMIDQAKTLAKQRGLEQHITFVQGALEDLSAFSDRQFDLVLSFDAPISYTYPNHETVLRELVRIGAKRLCISVYSRAAQVAYVFDPAQKQKYMLDPRSKHPSVRWYMKNSSIPNGFCPDIGAARAVLQDGLMEDPSQIAAAYERGETPWPISYAFLPEELQYILEKHGAKSVQLSGPGALGRSVPGEVLRTILQDEARRREFLDLCYAYDTQPGAAGLGKDNLVAIAEL